MLKRVLVLFLTLSVALSFSAEAQKKKKKKGEEAPKVELPAKKPEVAKKPEAPKKGPITNPKGGKNKPTIKPILVPQTPYFVPPNFLVPFEGKT